MCTYLTTILAVALRLAHSCVKPADAAIALHIVRSNPQKKKTKGKPQISFSDDHESIFTFNKGIFPSCMTCEGINKESQTFSCNDVVPYSALGRSHLPAHFSLKKLLLFACVY